MILYTIEIIMFIGMLAASVLAFVAVTLVVAKVLKSP